MTDPRDDLLRCQPHLPDMVEAISAGGEGRPRDGMVIGVPLLAAIGLRETWFGWAPGYTPLGDHNGRGDGGHGRGYWQIDDRGRFKNLIPPDGQDWPVLDQAKAAVLVLQTARHELAEFRALPVFEQACICRYNASLESVTRTLRIGVNPDLVTTGRDYGSDVLKRRDRLVADHPYAFPVLEVGG